MATYIEGGENCFYYNPLIRDYDVIPQLGGVAIEPGESTDVAPLRSISYQVRSRFGAYNGITEVEIGLNGLAEEIKTAGDVTVDVLELKEPHVRSILITLYGDGSQVLLGEAGPNQLRITNIDKPQDLLNCTIPLRANTPYPGSINIKHRNQ